MSIKFPYKSEKAINVALWFVKKHGGRMAIVKLMKLIFFADKLHLERYGRFIAGGDYWALKKGPVLSKLYDEIKENSSDKLRSSYGCVIATSGADVELGKFSKSDINILEEIESKLGSKSESELVDLSHEYECWKKSYPKPEENTSRRISTDDFFADFKGDSLDMVDAIRENVEIHNYTIA